MARSTKSSAATRGKDLRRHIIGRAIVDPQFRAKLFNQPEEIFQGKLSKSDVAALQRLRVTLPAFDDIVTSLAGEVLCGGGGGCGGLA